MLAYRLSRALNEGAKAEPFNLIWDKISSSVTMGRGSRQTVLEFMLEKSHMRPRDVVRYLALAAEEALSKGASVLEPVHFRDTELKYSERFRSELEDEINGLFGDAERAMDAISLIGKTTFEFEDFHSIYDNYGDDSPQSNSIRALEKLFKFSVIGLRREGEAAAFVYENSRVPFYWKSRFGVHYGLYKTLGLS